MQLDAAKFNKGYCSDCFGGGGLSATSSPDLWVMVLSVAGLVENNASFGGGLAGGLAVIAQKPGQKQDALPNYLLRSSCPGATGS